MKTNTLLSIFTVLSFLFHSCGTKGKVESPAENTVQVKVVKPQRINTSFPIICSGIVSSKTEIKLSFKTGGIIEKLLVDEGMTVRNNQILAQLKMSEIDAVVDQARLGYEKAIRDLHRAENLYSDSVTTLEQLQNAQTAVSLAKSQLNIAEFNKEHSTIKAPANGKILKKLGEINETIGAGYPLFIFSSSESDWVFRTALTDVDIVKTEFGDNAFVVFDAFPGKTFGAFVSEIANAADPYTGTYEVELHLNKPNPELISGLIGKATIIPDQRADYMALPLNVFHDAEGMTGTIYLLTDSSYHKKQIEVLNITDSLIYFDGALSESDRVIAEGAEYLSPRVKLVIVE